MKETLLEKARDDIWYAEIGMHMKPDDEGKLALAGFHLEQAVEKTLKYVLEREGIEYKRNHDLRELNDAVKSVEPRYSEIIQNYLYTLQAWVSRSRYETNFMILLSTLEEVKEATILLADFAEEQHPPVDCENKGGVSKMDLH